MGSLTADQWTRLAARLGRSRFRRRFRLGEREGAYLRERGSATVRAHARDFVRSRLAPAAPGKDGRQTPWHGHPVFIAQHATATCCRKCLARCHGIPSGRPLTDDETGYAVDVIMAWLGDTADGDA
jgi:hypothetical protein